MEGSEDDALTVKFPGYGHWGGVMGVQKGWRGQAESRAEEGQDLFWAPFSLPAPMHPCSDGKRPSCLPGKDVSVLAAARLNLPGAHRRLFPEASALRPPWDQALHSLPGSRCALNRSIPPASVPLCPNQGLEHPDLTRLGRLINNINQVRPGTW